MKRKIIIGVIAAVLLGFGVYYGVKNVDWKKPGNSIPQEFKFKEVKKGSIIDKIAEVGKLEPVSLVKVKSNVTGTVKKIFVEEGMYVKEGQKVALIKPGREAEQYQESEVLAPIAGLVIEKTVEEGDMVTSGLSELSGGTAIISVANLDKMIVKIDINEVDIGSVKEGLACKVKVEAFAAKAYIGRVLKISPRAIPSTDGKINIFKTEIEITTRAPELHTGMKAVVEIVLREKNNVLIAPVECIFEEDGEQCAYLRNGETWERRMVKSGLYDDDNIESVLGLQEKERLATTRPDDFEKLFKEKEEKKGEAKRGGRLYGTPPAGLIR